MTFPASFSSIVTGAPSSATSGNLYTGFNFTLLFVHAWNFIGEEESFNKVRGSIYTGVGGTYGSGYLGGLFRAGYEWRLGKHFSVSTVLGYRPKSTAFTGSTTGTAVSGVEAGLGINMLF